MATTVLEAAMTEGGRLLHENGCNCGIARCNVSEDQNSRSFIIECPECKVRALVSWAAAALLGRGEVKR